MTKLFDQRRDFARRRHALMIAHAELHERELIKLASLATAIGEALRRRGVRDPAASLAAEAGITIFKRAFEAWVGDGKKRDLGHHVRAAHAELEWVVAGTRRGRVTVAPARDRGAARPSRRLKKQAQGSRV